jgi:hypothetical protein
VTPLSLATPDHGKQARAGIPHVFVVVVRNDSIPGFPDIDNSSAFAPVRFRPSPASELEYQYVDVPSNRDSTGTSLDRRNSLIVVRPRSSQTKDPSRSKPLLVMFKIHKPVVDNAPDFGVDLVSTTVGGDTALGAGRCRTNNTRAGGS